jgi:two-component system OmpR family response regulator
MQGSQQLVLVIDDHRETADLIAEVLRDDGFAALTAGSGLEALRIYDAHRPSLVITDQLLVDGITGSDLLRTLRRKYGPAVGPALFLTGAPDGVTGLPKDLILEKPVGIDTLLAAVRSLLEGHPVARKATDAATYTSRR